MYLNRQLPTSKTMRDQEKDESAHRSRCQSLWDDNRLLQILVPVTVDNSKENPQTP